MPKGIPGSGPHAKKRKAGTARHVSKGQAALSAMALKTTPLSDIRFSDLPQLIMSGALVIHDKLITDPKKFLRGEN